MRETLRCGNANAVDWELLDRAVPRLNRSANLHDFSSSHREVFIERFDRQFDRQMGKRSRSPETSSQGMGIQL